VDLVGDEALLEARRSGDVLCLLEVGRLRLGVRRFPRRREDGFRVDPSEVERALSRRTRLVVLTSLGRALDAG
jgi:hypothetical protein